MNFSCRILFNSLKPNTIQKRFFDKQKFFAERRRIKDLNDVENVTFENALKTLRVI